MITRRFFLLLILMIFLLLFSCSKGGSKIKIGILPAIDSLPLVAAEAEGLFREEGLDLELVMFNSAIEKESAVLSSALHGSFGDMVTALLAFKSGKDVRIFTESSRTGRSRMFALVASPGSGLKDFKSVSAKQIAISSGSVIEFFLDGIAGSKGIKPESLRKLEVKGIPLRYQMVMSGQVKLAMLPEPLASKAEKEGASVIADDRGLDVTATVISFRGDFLENNPSFVKSFTAAYNKSVNMINSNPEKYRELLVSRLRLPEELKESFPMPRYNEVNPPSERDIEQVYTWMKKKGLLGRLPEYEKIIWKQ